MAETQAREFTGKIYLVRPSLFSITQESSDPVDGWETDERRNPQTGEIKTKWVRRVPGLTGFIDDMRWVIRDENDFKIERLEIQLSDGTDWEAILQIGSNTGKAFQVLKMAENIDFTKLVEISVWKGRDKEKQKDQAVLTIRQAGEIVRWKYTAANPGNMPPGVQNRRGEWDFSDQEGWLLDLLEQRIRPIIKASRIERENAEAPIPRKEAAAAMQAQARQELVSVENEEDIPF